MGNEVDELEELNKELKKLLEVEVRQMNKKQVNTYYRDLGFVVYKMTRVMGDRISQMFYGMEDKYMTKEREQMTKQELQQDDEIRSKLYG